MPRTGTTAQRGYGAQHKTKRATWAPLVTRGDVDCHATTCLVEADGGTRRIQPGQRWHLGHTPDRSKWTGPEHERCNTGEGASRGNATRGHLDEPEPAARRWVL